MLFYTIALFAFLFFKEVFLPVLAYNQYRAQQRYEEELKQYKLKVIKTYYPVLLGMSYDEINERYSVNRVFESVGKHSI